MKLARDDLRGTWVEGLIVGFIRKDRAEALLSNCQSGTFLLRFSDSILGLLYQFLTCNSILNLKCLLLGGITIAWVNQRVGQPPSFVNCAPFDHKALTVRSISDRINDLGQCVYLYPDIPKDTVFEKHYSKSDRKTISFNNFSNLKKKSF